MTHPNERFKEIIRLEKEAEGVLVILAAKLDQRTYAWAMTDLARLGRAALEHARALARAFDRPIVWLNGEPDPLHKVFKLLGNIFQARADIAEAMRKKPPHFDHAHAMKRHLDLSVEPLNMVVTELHGRASADAVAGFLEWAMLEEERAIDGVRGQALGPPRAAEELLNTRLVVTCGDDRGADGEPPGDVLDDEMAPVERTER